jgi:hypothetical protein
MQEPLQSSPSLALRMMMTMTMTMTITMMMVFNRHPSLRPKPNLSLVKKCRLLNLRRKMTKSGQLSLNSTVHPLRK